MTEEKATKEKNRKKGIAYNTFHFFLGVFFLFRGIYFLIFESNNRGSGLLLLCFAAILMFLHRPNLWFKEDK